VATICAVQGTRTRYETVVRIFVRTQCTGHFIAPVRLGGLRIVFQTHPFRLFIVQQLLSSVSFRSEDGGRWAGSALKLLPLNLAAQKL
jgi:hypothetical protein